MKIQGLEYKFQDQEELTRQLSALESALEEMSLISVVFVLDRDLEVDLLFGPLYDEYEFFNDVTSCVNKSSSPTDNSAPQDIHPSTNIHPTSEPTTQTNVHAEENKENQAEFTNPFCTPA
ncbi:hypothetical protein Tco_0364229 [Tanacetum coccineum]